MMIRSKKSATILYELFWNNLQKYQTPTPVKKRINIRLRVTRKNFAKSAKPHGLEAALGMVGIAIKFCLLILVCMEVIQE